MEKFGIQIVLIIKYIQQFDKNARHGASFQAEPGFLPKTLTIMKLFEQYF